MKHFIVVLLVLFSFSFSLFALEEGGYAGTTDEGHDTVVYNFLINFSYEQYYYAIQSQFTSNNNNRVDNMDIAIFAGHGNQWLIATTDGNVNLATAGSTSHLGYGDTDCEFIAFESCKVVPSPLELSDWYTNWVHTNGIFDRLHQALGFRTNSYQSTDQNISGEFGKQVAAGKKVIDAWLDAINKYRTSSEYGSIVYYPTCRDDTYTNVAADPPADSGSLNVIYQY